MIQRILNELQFKIITNLNAKLMNLVEKKVIIYERESDNASFY